MKPGFFGLFAILGVLLCSPAVFAESHISGKAHESNLSDKNIRITQNRVSSLMKKFITLENETNQGNIWTKIYSNYQTFRELKSRQEKILSDIYRLKHKRRLEPEEEKELEALQLERQTNEGKLQLLSEFQSDPFQKLLEPPKTGDIPKVGNPLRIISAFSYLKNLKSDQIVYEENFKTLELTIRALQREKRLLREMLRYQPENRDLALRMKEISKELETLHPVYEIFKTTKEVYNKKIEEIRLKLNEEIKREMEKAATIAGIVLFLFILFLIFKRLVRKYLSDKESFYTINKVANFLFINILVLILLFAYIENVDYIITILGFASAGIAIAMKDWFMSLMGWFVIVLGGSIHVGDRIKVVRDGIEYIGDVVDISLLRMTIHEDITLTTYMRNRRTGRIIFVPNNYIFTDMIANYSHAGLKTVWDGIDFTITFDSDVSRAVAIAKEVTKKYSKGYTDITRKQLNKLRSSYHLKNTNVEPRIYSFIEPYGVCISAWYMTNAFATLTLRSTISAEILEKIRAEENIVLAYPTQSLYLDRSSSRPSLTGKAPHTRIPQETDT
jgi:small-conductance mechanosensitive channel